MDSCGCGCLDCGQCVCNHKAIPFHACVLSGGRGSCCFELVCIWPYCFWVRWWLHVQGSVLRTMSALQIGGINSHSYQQCLKVLLSIAFSVLACAVCVHLMAHSVRHGDGGLCLPVTNLFASRFCVGLSACVYAPC